MNLAIANYRETAVDIVVELLRPDVAKRSEARVYRERAEIPKMAGEGEIWRRENVAPSRRYRVELDVHNSETTHHYHYQPSCSGESVDDIGVRVNLNGPEQVRFTQSECAGG
jgi:hypothetical protein